jgi:hypothetical protein
MAQIMKVQAGNPHTGRRLSPPRAPAEVTSPQHATARAREDERRAITPNIGVQVIPQGR